MQTRYTSTNYPPEARDLFLQGHQRLTLGQTQAAEACFIKALLLAPDFVEALINLGWVNEQHGAVAEAEACYKRALTLRPDCVRIYLNLGVLFLHTKRFFESEAACRRAVQIAPHDPEVWSQLGVLLACVQREQEAERCFLRALELDGAHAQTRFNFSYLLLRQGRLQQGWQYLEARTQENRWTPPEDCLRWNGEEIAGKSLLIGFEAGYGDMIQFSRYAAVLKTRGAQRVGIVCHPGLARLLGSLGAIDTVYSLGADPSAQDWNFWAPLLSLPYHCGTTLDNIPTGIPYLSALPEDRTLWGSRLPPANCRVGLVWKGNPLFENDADRSVPALEQFAPLGRISGVQWISLQKGAGEEEAQHPPAGFPLLAFGESLQDFADTAALLAHLDLVITVDTAVAHLAGAMGKPCWVLLPNYLTDWRWLSERVDSPWYLGTMRLFRQAKVGDWSQVIEEVAVALAASVEHLAGIGRGNAGTHHAALARNLTP